MWLMNLGKPVKIPKLNEAMAIELGASLLSEIIIFCIAASLLVAEVNRQARKEAKKEAARRDELSEIQYSIQQLYFEARKQDIQIQEIMRILSDIENKAIDMPLKSTLENTPPTMLSPYIRPGVDSINDINNFFSAI